MKKKHPYYRAIPSDFFGSPTVRQMSPDTRAYFRLLHDIVWDFDTQYSIPDDENLISKLFEISVQKWKTIRAEIFKTNSKKLSTMQGNFSLKNGRIHLGYLKAEKQRVDKEYKRQREKGVKGAKARWGS